MAEEAGRALWERLEAHHKAGYLSLHMPGHKENAALAPYLARLGAELWGSRKSYFQVNGSTGGLLAAIRAATRRGDQVLVARHCHKAVYHAIELCGLDPVFLLPRWRRPSAWPAPSPRSRWPRRWRTTRG